MSRTEVSAHGPAPVGPAPLRRVAVAGITTLIVAGALVGFGLAHAPDGSFGLLGRGDAAYRLKSQLATLMLALALVQVTFAAVMYGAIPGIQSRFPVKVSTLHRIGGLALFLLSIPIALHCLLTYGVQLSSARTAVHSVAGCLFYGAFVAKVILVRGRGLPRWVLPVSGGLLAVLIGVLWYSSALWYWGGSAWPLS